MKRPKIRRARGVAAGLALLSILCWAPARAQELPDDAEQRMQPVIDFLDSPQYAAAVSWDEHVVLSYLVALGRPPTAIEFFYLGRLREDIALPRSEVLGLALQDDQIEPNGANFARFITTWVDPGLLPPEIFGSTPRSRRELERLSREELTLPAEESGAPEADLSPLNAPIAQVDFLAFFGFMHSHSELSDGDGTAKEAYDDARSSGLDFFALTDHGERLVIWPWDDKWDRLRTAADNANLDDVFTALWGFEWSNPFLGHVTVIQSDRFTHTLVETRLSDLFSWLNGEPAAFARLNHPGTYDDLLGIEFRHLLRAQLTPHPRVVGIEVWNKNDGLAEHHDTFEWAEVGPTYLAQGSRNRWRLGALGAQDNHQRQWGSLNDFRVGALVPDQLLGTPDLSRLAIAEAFRARRFYATEEKELKLQVWASGHPMGSELDQIQPVFDVKVSNGACGGGQAKVASLELFRDGESVDETSVNSCSASVVLQDACGPLPGRHSYTVVATMDNANRALSSPIWITFPEPVVVPQLFCPADPPDLDGCWPTAQELSDFNQWMACLGPRFTGTMPHDDFLQEIDDAMSGVPGVTASPVDTHFINWQQENPWPTVQLGPNPAMQAAGYMPYSGLDTVTGELVYERPGFWRRKIPLLNLIKRFKFKRSKHEGKIVAVELPRVAVPRWLLKCISRKKRSDFRDWAPYERTIALEKLAPCLGEARRAGVKGVIGVLDMSPEHAEKQYLPFAREPDRPIGEGVPGVYVDSIQGALVKAHAQSANPIATISLDGTVDCCATSQHLVYTLPGASFGTNTDEIVLLQTHTDGPSAFEENGPIALIALAYHLAQTPQADRERTVVFLFATGHFVKQIEGAKDLLWHHPPAWFERTRVAVAIEHLGADEWIDAAGGYDVRKDPLTGVPLAEPPLLFVTTHDFLEDLAHTRMAKKRRILIPARKRVKVLFKRDFFGEGQSVSCSGVPTVGYVPNPNYLFSFADPGGAPQPGHFDKLNPHRMLAELNQFRSLIDFLVNGDLTGLAKETPDISRCEAPEDPCE